MGFQFLKELVTQRWVPNGQKFMKLVEMLLNDSFPLSSALKGINNFCIVKYSSILRILDNPT